MSASQGKDVRERLVIALDVDSYDRAAGFVDQLSPHAGWFKIGSVLFTREGPRVCQLIKDSGAKLFLDLKFHDIPNTVRGAVQSAALLGADMVTVHTSGGDAMLKAAVQARNESGNKEMTIVGVTVLTHLGPEDFRSLFGQKTAATPERAVALLAQSAKQAGIDGVVASAGELPHLKEQFGRNFVVVTPGIRLLDNAKDDQTRVATPARAVADGADYLVVGRPVTAALDPIEACRRIVEDMRSSE